MITNPSYSWTPCKNEICPCWGYNPPVVVIHGNQVSDLPDSYKRYLMNYFRRTLQVMGTPIRIQFKEGENPLCG